MENTNVTVELTQDVTVINKELKRVASLKSRLKKQKGRADYAPRMQEALAYEERLKQARAGLLDSPPKYTTLTEVDIAALPYETVVKALKSVQSKKSNSRWLTDVEGDNDEYRKAVELEGWLKARRDILRPTPTNQLATIIDWAKSDEAITKEMLLDVLTELL